MSEQGSGKFLLFTSPSHYPMGGMTDCKGQFDTMQGAMGYALANLADSWGGIDDMHILELGDTLMVHICSRDDYPTVETLAGDTIAKNSKLRISKSKTLKEFIGEI